MTEQTTEIDLKEEVIRVIGYREDGLWYALGLEVSILGYGKTFQEAVSLLEELIQEQIEFCNENAMSYHYRSEEKYFQLYEELKNRESQTESTRSDESIAYSFPTENQRPKIGQLSIHRSGTLSR